MVYSIDCTCRAGRVCECSQFFLQDSVGLSLENPGFKLKFIHLSFSIEFKGPALETL